jgi:hypothetical protein
MYTLLHLSGKGNKPPQSAGNVVYVCTCVRALLLYHLLKTAVHKMLLLIFRLHGQVSKCTLLSNRRLRIQRLEGNDEWLAVVYVL